MDERAGVFDKVLGWLRRGYPYGIPQRDYIALFGLLHRTLTGAEVEAIARELHEGAGGLDSNIPRERIAALIEETILEEASEDDIRRVAGRLAKGGWPLVGLADLGAEEQER